MMGINKHPFLHTIVSISVLLFSTFIFADSAEVADTVIVGGDIYTVDDDAPHASAVAIKDGKFRYVGNDREAQKWMGENTQVLKLNGQMILPGLTDAHTHPGILSLFASIELVAAPDSTPHALLAWLKQYADENPDIDFITAGFWRTSDFGLAGPHKEMLDRIISDRPVALMDDSGHSYWLNSQALEVMGINRDTPDPAPGLAYYQRDQNNEPTGWIKEFSSAPIQEHLMNTATHEDLEKNLSQFLGFLSSKGVTHLYDGGNLWLHDKVYSVLAKMDREGNLPLYYEGTVHVHLPEQIDQAIPELIRLRNTYGTEHLRFNTVKIHFDGVHEIRTSAVLKPFSDDPTNRGGTLISQERLEAFIKELHQEKLDLHLHVVGDRATQIALDAYEAAGADHWDYPRLTLCHLELVSDKDIPRFKELGVIANFTPHWFGDLFQGGAATLGERNNHKMRAKTFFNSGAVVTFSSDMVTPGELERANPFMGIQVGHNRQDVEGGEAAKIMPPVTERLSLEQLIKGYTLNGAYQLRNDVQSGSISVGKNADLVIVQSDPFTVDPYQIHQTQVLKTMIDGKFVYEVNSLDHP